MHEKDSQVVSIFTLSGSTSIKAERKCVGEIDTRRERLIIWNGNLTAMMSLFSKVSGSIDPLPFI